MYFLKIPLILTTKKVEMIFSFFQIYFHFENGKIFPFFSCNPVQKIEQKQRFPLLEKYFWFGLCDKGSKAGLLRSP